MDIIYSVLCLTVLLQICINNVTTQVSGEESVNILPVEAVAGSYARLPCDVTPPTEGDRVHLIIWYKGLSNLPIYSFDSRDISTDEAAHWSDEATLGKRAYFKFKENPAALFVQNIRDSDEGLYRCRIDFRKSPTRNYKVNLTVILPPDKLSVLDERGVHIQHYNLGPYNLGSSVEITCIATGGRPLPNVTWWQDNSLIDDTFDVLSAKRVRNVLHIDRVERHHLNTVFTCQASNNEVLAPISSAVTLDLNLPPLWVKLQGDQRPFIADQTYELACEVVGSRPVPIITWLKGEYLLRNNRASASNDDNTTISTISFVPGVEDSGQKLTCRAISSYALDTHYEDSWILNVYHIPLVNLDLQKELKGINLKEGMDITLQCAIRSNPWVYRISWKHNGKVLYHNASAGTVITNQSLILFNVTKARSGTYSCMGSNQEGDGESDPFYLDIKYPKSFDNVYADEILVKRVKRSRTTDITLNQTQYDEIDTLSRIWEVEEEKLTKVTQMVKTLATLEDKKIFFMRKLRNSIYYRNEILELTKNQSFCNIWFKERRKRLTASNFGRICLMRETTSCKNLVWSLLYDTFKTNVYIEHGKETEPIARKHLQKKYGIQIEETGLFIDKELPFLAATPVIPICRPGQQRMIGIARQETARISCEVEANPQEVKFTWSFNSTVGSVDLLPSSFVTEGMRSVAAFTPYTEHDYGSLLCWAKNDLGLQQTPCVYSLTPVAGRPDRVFNCTIHNQTADTLHVECEEGYNGGLDSEYVMEVYDLETNVLVSNATFRLPLFIVTGLPSGEGFDINLYAVNSKGRSPSTVLHAYTLQSAARRSALSPVILHLTPMLGILAGIAFSLFFVTLGIILGLRFRRHNNDDQKKPKSKESSDSIESLEKNPDIIPQNSDLMDSEEIELNKLKEHYFPLICAKK